MEDVGRIPSEVSAMQNVEPTTIGVIDGWIGGLMDCKQLAESEVQRLCEKVCRPPRRLCRSRSPIFLRPYLPAAVFLPDAVQLFDRRVPME